jgi:RNA polymerase sigma factor (TIGR02999 family)
MSDVTRILSQIESGDPSAAEQLLPLVYEELRKLAAAKLAQEKPGQTLQATALVHEAYVRLVGQQGSTSWEGRGHFFAAAAEAMRRILVEQARRKKRLKHGGTMQRVELPDLADSSRHVDERIVEVDTALSRLAQEDPLAAQVVNLHYFAGLPLEDVGKVLGLSRATAYRQWTYARSWLKSDIERST